jgi:hypothetical protein
VKFECSTFVVSVGTLVSTKKTKKLLSFFYQPSVESGSSTDPVQDEQTDPERTYVEESDVHLIAKNAVAELLENVFSVTGLVKEINRK